MFCASAVLLGIVACLAEQPYGKGHGAPEATLRANLEALRSVLEQYRADHGHYPVSLEETLDAGYLRSIPIDPITRSDQTWVVTVEERDGRRQVVAVHSGALGVGSDGTAFSEW